MIYEVRRILSVPHQALSTDAKLVVKIGFGTADYGPRKGSHDGLVGEPRRRESGHRAPHPGSRLRGEARRLAAAEFLAGFWKFLLLLRCTGRERNVVFFPATDYGR